MFIRALIGAASRGGGGSRLYREGLSHANSSHSSLETERSHRNNEVQPSSYNFLRELSGSESPQRREGDRSRSSVSSESGTYSDVLRDQFGAQRETDRSSVSNSTRFSETSGSYHDALSNHESESETDDPPAHNDRSESHSLSSYEAGSEIDDPPAYDDRSNTTSVYYEAGSETDNPPAYNESNTTSVYHDARSDTTSVYHDARSENPSASDYAEHLETGRPPNKLRKDRERAEENERELRRLLKKGLDLIRDPNWRDHRHQQMNSLIIPMAAGSLEQVESKMAPNPRE